MDTIGHLQHLLSEFARERDWEQFHTPKNLAMALTGEAGELAAEFQWLTPEQSLTVMDQPASAAAVEGEIADVAIYLLRLCDVLGVALADVVQAKIDVNRRRFPPQQSES